MTLSTLAAVPTDLLIAKELVYQPAGLDYSDLEAEKESADYSAYSFNLNGLAVKYREAKITPTKTGQFVTLWKRNEKGPIEPFHLSDNIDLFIISTRNHDLFGQFIFPKSVLHKKGIVSDNNKEGKRAIRVYPPWVQTNNKQAAKTQQWQSEYFLEISTVEKIDLPLAKRLLKRLEI